MVQVQQQTNENARLLLGTTLWNRCCTLLAIDKKEFADKLATSDTDAGVDPRAVGELHGGPDAL